jgi:hypothetical protein
MRLFFLLIAVLALGLAGGATSATTVAAAHRASSLTSLTATRPAGHIGRGIGETAIGNSCSIRNGFFTALGGSCRHPVKYTCQVGGNAKFSFPPSYVSNGCSTRVIIYTGATLNGRSLCIGPHSATHRLRRTYRSFRIGSSRFC